MTPTSSLGEVRPEHDRDAGSDLVLVHYVRAFALPVVDLWERITEADKVPDWFGIMTGDPFGGTVAIHTDDDCRRETMTVRIDNCLSPHELDVTIDGGVLELRLSQVGVVTTLEVIRRHLHPSEVAEVGPRWQYYLDRLEASIARVPLPTWADYAELPAEYR
ncbi:hypothetical protein [Antrihabitans cavernicola]|uniref:SRPBCC family protein n=1 Tax=Antrihabitans cavernicola TaxID=2495913 RepID=A0A5A7SDD6_9NOCA|nr:hypothetical protein [Spelaeibacter cavernicola]KAA0023554.1 hypothetical protein FOY51_09160 [Spelaeibacter cavernicola]